jgi:hypothetical protein
MTHSAIQEALDGKAVFLVSTVVVLYATAVAVRLLRAPSRA